MKIKIKLKRNELHNLVELLEKTIHNDCSDRSEAIIMTLMIKFYQKLKQKQIIIDKPALTISVEPETAMAFVEFFRDYPEKCYILAANVVNKMISNYDQQTTNFFK